MPYYKVPMLIDAFRLTDRTLSDTVTNVVDYLKQGAGGWNHQRAARYLRFGFDGGGDLKALVAACKGDGRKPFLDNAKIVESALPYVLGRRAQSFAYPKTKLALTPDFHSAIGPAFFVVEGGQVKLIYVHARNEGRASPSDLAAFAAMAKKEILDNDFYGIPGDVEIHLVDKVGGNRLDNVLRLADLASELREPPEATLARFIEAFAHVDANRLAGPPKARRQKQKVEEERSLFDF